MFIFYSLVLLNFTYTATLVSQSLCRIITAKFLDEGASISCYISGEFNGIDSFQDDVVRSHWIGTGKWWCT